MLAYASLVDAGGVRLLVRLRGVARLIHRHAVVHQTKAIVSAVTAYRAVIFRVMIRCLLTLLAFEQLLQRLRLNWLLEHSW